MRVLAFSGGKDSMACLFLLRNTIDCALFVDTGKTYPETQAMVEFASTIVPVQIVETNQDAQNAREGIPSDIVPVNWTRLGQQMTGPKPVTVQNYMICCFENIALPLVNAAKALKADEIVYGQRENEAHRSTSKNGDRVEGMIRLHPIEGWTSQQVLRYLETQMQVPPHFYIINHSSLDCYDCTAYATETRDLVTFTAGVYPEFYKQYLERKELLDAALTEALREKQL
jgi:3'-phosphoadenosine 5'-phosphosulfate sulfotransferase (PAPS reductase)/FAD synthetase